MPKGSDLVKVPGSPIVVAREKLHSMSEDIAENYFGGSSEDFVAQMAAQILDAENFEDLFIGFGQEPDKELFDKGLNVQEITFNRSTYEVGLPYYATFKGKRLDNGEDFVTNCGAWQTVVVAYMMLKKNWLPRNLYFHRAETPTAAGFYPINILPYVSEEPF